MMQYDLLSSFLSLKDSGEKLKRLDIIIRPAVKRPPSITMSPIKPAPAEIRCKLAEERRKVSVLFLGRALTLR